MITRGFVEVAGRLVHYRRAGHGPPCVMFHGSPGDAEMLTAEIEACAARFTVFALDTAGFGSSDPLPGETLTVTDLAGAAAAAMAALGLPRCPAYGTHTGAAIAIELAVNWPERVSGVVLEGLPAFTEAEIEALFGNYFAPMVPDPLGGHLTSTWVRFRDQFTWFPWPSRDVKRLNALDRPAPADIDLWVSMFYRSCATYRPAYRAACHYGAAALRAAAALTLPAVFTATVEDMLFPHLDRLPPLRPGQRIERLPSEPAARIAAIAGFLAEFESGGEAPAATLPSPMARHLFIRGPHGEIFLRRYGDPAQPALLLLHDAPGTGRGLAETARRLAADHHVLVPDQPGCGLTAAPPAGDILEAAADNALALLDALGLERVTVAATGCGAAVAARLADRADPRIARLYAAGAPPPDAARIAPDLPLSATGAHWVQAWLMLRDAEIYAPWYEGTVAAQRRTQGNFDALERHEQTAALMEGRTTYHLYPRAAAAAPSTHPAITALPAGALRDFTPGTAPC